MSSGKEASMCLPRGKMSEKLFINMMLFIRRFKRFRRPFLFVPCNFILWLWHQKCRKHPEKKRQGSLRKLLFRIFYLFEKKKRNKACSTFVLPHKRCVLHAAFYRGINFYVQNFPAITQLSLEYDTFHFFYILNLRIFHK